MPASVLFSGFPVANQNIPSAGRAGGFNALTSMQMGAKDILHAQRAKATTKEQKHVLTNSLRDARQLVETLPPELAVKGLFLKGRSSSNGHVFSAVESFLKGDHKPLALLVTDGLETLSQKINQFGSKGLSFVKQTIHPFLFKPLNQQLAKDSEHAQAEDMSIIQAQRNLANSIASRSSQYIDALAKHLGWSLESQFSKAGR